jgi:hypothetical protein
MPALCAGGLPAGRDDAEAWAECFEGAGHALLEWGYDFEAAEVWAVAGMMRERLEGE